MLGLIADDLTGANDSAVQFAQRGWDTLLVLDTKKDGATVSSEPFSCRALTTDARGLDNATAEKLTADALAQLIGAGADRIFLKIDSTMRGSVPGQVAGALAAWRTRHPDARAIVCPAYPRMGRTVVANRLLVEGQPVEQTPIGRDPVSPVTTSDLSVLLPGSSYTPIKGSATIVTIDAQSDEDLGKIASAIEAAGPSVIPVGSAGLAMAVAAVRSARLQPGRDPLRRFANPRILILVTSLNPVSRGQAGRLVQAFPHTEMLLAPSERVGDLSVAENLAEAFANRVVSGRWDVLGLVGGDGARAALRRLESSAIRILGTVIEGIPFGIVVGGRADGMPVFTKAGGFGTEDALVRVVERITA